MAKEESFEQLLRGVREHVDRELDLIWKAARGEHSRHGIAVSGPLEAAAELSLRGGKRLRAALVAVGYRLGGERGELGAALHVCCAVELLQAYFLIHDDWMDGDRLRRGGPAVHAALEERFASPHLAAAGAVLAGDYTLALATRVLARAEPPRGRWPILLARFAQMQLDAVVGQKLDVLGDGENLDEVYRLKTASYTVLGPLHLGLALSATPAPSDASLEAFAVPLGIAFQLRDDLIGAFADSAVTGKPRGSDLRSGKRTLLLRTALSLADVETQRLIRSVVGNLHAAPDELSAALAALDACGARAGVERRIEALATEARAALASTPWEPGARLLLEGLLVALIERAS